MTDPNNSEERTRTRINLSDKYEVAHWTARLNVSESQLRDAVAKVGIVASDVEREIRNGAWTLSAKRAKQG